MGCVLCLPARVAKTTEVVTTAQRDAWRIESSENTAGRQWKRIGDGAPPMNGCFTQRIESSPCATEVRKICQQPNAVISCSSCRCFDRKSYAIPVFLTYTVFSSAIAEMAVVRRRLRPVRTTGCLR